MTIPTFNPPVAPSPGTRRSQEIKILAASFGDGYEQVQADGLNHIRKSVELRWDALTLPEMDAIMSFFEEQQGFRPFWYQPYGFSAPPRWTCREFEASADAPWRVRARLAQHFG